ncbi:MAG: hypothetical protein PHY62_04200 [Gallionella sp.]|nr:hypothetical protein [Gallionella sp.]
MVTKGGFYKFKVLMELLANPLSQRAGKWLVIKQDKPALSSSKGREQKIATLHIFDM